MQVIDVATNKIVGDLPSGPDPEQLNIHPSGNAVYIANEDDNLVTVIDLDTREVLGPRCRSASSRKASASAQMARS